MGDMTTCKFVGNASLNNDSFIHCVIYWLLQISIIGQICSFACVDARYWYSNSLRPSVRNAPVLDENGLTYRHSFFHHTINPNTTKPYHSSFTSIKPLHKIPTGSSPEVGAKYRWGIKISRFSTNKWLYLANDTKYRHSYYGRRIGTRMRSIKWCHFQW